MSVILARVDLDPVVSTAFAYVDGAPGAGDGTALGVGSVAIDVSTGEIHRKTGSGPTEWTKALAVAGSSTSLHRLTGAVDPTDGVTGAGVVAFGEFYLNTATGNVFRNIGTLASPTYKGWVST